MITRRGFLGLLMGLAAAPVLSRLPTMDNLGGISVTASPIILPTISNCAELLGLEIFGSGKDKKPGSLRILRPDASRPVLEFSFNELGGSVFWRAPIGGGIICLTQLPLVIDMTNSNAIASLLYRNQEGDFKRHVIMNRLFMEESSLA